jgi:hypothetical protein
MAWSTRWPDRPGLYWYRHHGSNAPEPVKVTADAHVLFIGDWRSHPMAKLVGALWGDPISLPQTGEEAGA